MQIFNPLLLLDTNPSPVKNLAVSRPFWAKEVMKYWPVNLAYLDAKVALTVNWQYCKTVNEYTQHIGQLTVVLQSKG